MLLRGIRAGAPCVGGAVPILAHPSAAARPDPPVRSHRAEGASVRARRPRNTSAIAPCCGESPHLAPISATARHVPSRTCCPSRTPSPRCRKANFGRYGPTQSGRTWPLGGIGGAGGRCGAELAPVDDLGRAALAPLQRRALRAGNLVPERHHADDRPLPRDPELLVHLVVTLRRHPEEQPAQPVVGGREEHQQRRHARVDVPVGHRPARLAPVGPALVRRGVPLQVGVHVGAADDQRGRRPHAAQPVRLLLFLLLGGRPEPLPLLGGGQHDEVPALAEPGARSTAGVLQNGGQDLVGHRPLRVVSTNHVSATNDLRELHGGMLPARPPDGTMGPCPETAGPVGPPRVDPSQWEADVVLRDGSVGHVRPIRPDDADGLRTFHSHQSEESIYLRFFAPIRELSDRDVFRFTQRRQHRPRRPGHDRPWRHHRDRPLGPHRPPLRRGRLQHLGPLPGQGHRVGPPRAPRRHRSGARRRAVHGRGPPAEPPDAQRLQGGGVCGPPPLRGRRGRGVVRHPADRRSRTPSGSPGSTAPSR